MLGPGRNKDKDASLIWVKSGLGSNSSWVQLGLG